jgi:hypothetical protein
MVDGAAKPARHGEFRGCVAFGSTAVEVDAHLFAEKSTCPAELMNALGKPKSSWELDIRRKAPDG